jgi:hypothetical protein
MRVNPRTFSRDDDTITIDDVAIARWRAIPADELPHVRREVSRWVESLHAVAQGGVGREERQRRDRQAMQLLALVADLAADAPEEPHIDVAIAKDLVAYWHYFRDKEQRTGDRG